MKCSTRHDATASIGDHEVPASAAVTSAIKLGTASFSVSALASSWATNANVGEPLNTVVAAPAAPDVQPVPMPASGMAPQRVAVFPMLQLQPGPGSIPSASTSATRVVTTAVVVGAAAAAAGAGEGGAAGSVTGVVAGGAAAVVGGGAVTFVAATGTAAVGVRVFGTIAAFSTTGRAEAGPRVCFAAGAGVGGPEVGDGVGTAQREWGGRGEARDEECGDDHRRRDDEDPTQSGAVPPHAEINHVLKLTGQHMVVNT